MSATDGVDREIADVAASDRHITTLSPMATEVLEGMRRPQKEISPKYFYDTRGSRIFESITRLPEYYLTRTEHVLLERWIPGWFGEMAPAGLVELGAGSSRKTRVLLDAMISLGSGRSFLPLDLSEEFLSASADRLREEYPELEISPVVADLSMPLELPAEVPEPTVFALLGSTLGNFAPDSATRLLDRIGTVMRSSDTLLLGADLRPGGAKTVELLEAAYNDSRGVTAEFNLNVLRVLNAELDADFDLSAFRHRAFYEAAEGRIEMHLVSRRAQSVRFGAGELVSLGEGESIRTEISAKYDRATLGGLLERAGLAITHWREDGEGFYAIVMARKAH